jgi:DNA primase
VRSVKFLFLPQEHDPDSYIREFGKEAFAHCVTEAMPLSRFLIEVAREGCDLHTAEGRAHMASNAKPLWTALPDGALKRQLLSEIAELAELGNHELQDLWSPAPAPTHAPRKGEFKKSGSSFKPRQTYAPTAKRGTRQIPAGRADHAVRVLLTHMTLWDDLSTEDHNLLCELAPPHGQLFVWLDHQHHEHGNQAWGALREALRGSEVEDLAVRVMATAFTPLLDDEGKPLPDTQTPEQQRKEAQLELRGILNKMLLESLDQQMKDAIAEAAANPAAMQRYKALFERRKQIHILPSQLADNEL